MVRKASIIIIASIFLVSCPFFFMTPFPAFLPFVEKSVDLKDKVGDYEDDWECYQLYLLNNYLFMTVDGEQLIIFDADLDIKAEHSGDYGRLAFTDGTDYYIGKERYNSSLVYVSSLGNRCYAVGYFDGAIAYALESDDSGNLNSFTSVGPDFNLFGASFDIATTGIRLDRLDFDPASLDVYLFFRWEHSEGEAEVIQVLNIEIAGGLGTLPINSYPFGKTIVTLSELDDGRYYYTRDGFVGVGESELRRYGFDGEEKAGIKGCRIRRFAAAFDIDGDKFYFFDADSKKLYRCRTWWD